MNDTKIWPYYNTGYIIYIRSGLVKRFENKYSVDIFNEYFDKKGIFLGKAYYISNENYSEILTWLKKDKVNSIKFIEGIGD